MEYCCVLFLVLSLLPSQGFLRARSGLTFHALENGINVAPCHLLSQVFILPEQVRQSKQELCMDRADERSYHPHSSPTCPWTAVSTPEFSTQLSLPQSCPFFLISPPNLISYRPG